MKGGFMSVRAAAERLQVNMQFVYLLIWNRKLTAHKEGNRWLISESSVAARIKQQKEGRPGK
jgi:excisionase family DNA binding protein